MSTREAILRFLKRRPGATVRELAQALGMTSANVRHHLNQLEAQGLVRAQNVPSQAPRRGRPAKQYYLTEKALPTFLEPLTRALLTYFRRHQIPLTVLCPLLCPHGPPQGTLRQRLQRALEFFRERAYQPRWEAHKSGPHILFDQCPYGSLSQEFPELCQFDREMLAYLLGVPVEAVQVGPGKPMCIFALQIQPVPQAAADSSSPA